MNQIQVDPSIISMISSESIRTVQEALVELITNSIDSYNKISSEGVIEITSDSKVVCVRDYGVGMTSEEMLKYLTVVGQSSLHESSRGVFGRGCKDLCVICEYVDFIGESTLRIYNNFTYEVREGSNSPGFRVEMHLLEEVGDLTDSLNRNYLLRNILQSSFKVYFNGMLLKYTPYDMEKVISFDYSIAGYPDATANLQLFITGQPIPNPKSELELEFAGLVFSDKSVYEAGGLTLDLPNYAEDYRWNKYSKYVVCKLQCNYIDYLIRDYRINGSSKLNPFICVESNRRRGLNKKHPFTIELFKIAYNFLSLGINLVRDKLDESISFQGHGQDLFTGIMQDLNDTLPTDDQLYAWRSKDNQRILDSLTGISSNVSVNNNIIDIAEQLENKGVQFISKPKKNYLMQVFYDDSFEHSYEIGYYSDKTLIKINCADNSIKHYVTFVDNVLNVEDQRAILAIMTILRTAIVEILTRSKLLKGTSTTTTNNYNEIKALQVESASLVSGYMNKAYVSIRDKFN